MHRPVIVGLASHAAVLAAAGLLAAASAQAQSAVQLYGLIDLSVGHFQVAGTKKLKRLDSGNMSTSYLGFKGTEDLGGGLKAGFTLESFLLADSGGAGRVPGVDAFWGRNANVSLSGGFGTLRLGRMGPPMFVSSLLFNAYGDSFGYSPTIRQYYNFPHGGTQSNSASVPVDNGAILAASGSSESTTAGVAGKPESEMLTLGYNYKLSKHTDVYALDMSDKYTGKSSGTTLAAGVKHTF